MKTTYIAAALAALLTLNSNAQKTTSGCFWALPTITDGPGNPLSGSGFGSIAGSFTQVQWYSGDVAPIGSITDCDGKFKFDLNWNDADANGISYTSDWSVPGILFDTSPGDSLLFGNPEIKIDCPGCTIDEVKFLICTIPDKGLTDEINKYTTDGYGVYVTDGKTYSSIKPDGIFNLGTDGLGIDGKDYTTSGLSYAYSLDGKDFVSGDGKTDFDTIVKIGACVTCVVPEPSSALLVALGSVALVTRRRRA